MAMWTSGTICFILDVQGLIFFCIAELPRVFRNLVNILCDSYKYCHREVRSILPVRHGIVGGVQGAGGLHLNLLEIAGLNRKLHDF
jgi:hypothetical protein